MRRSSEREVPRTRVSFRVHFFLSRDFLRLPQKESLLATDISPSAFPHICWKFYSGIGLDQGQKSNFTGNEPNAYEREQINYILFISITFITGEVRRDPGDNPDKLIYRVMSESNLIVYFRSLICFLQIPSTTATEVLACVAGVLKGKGKGVLGARETRGALLPSSRAPRVSRANSLSLPFQTPATQATEVHVQLSVLW